MATLLTEEDQQPSGTNHDRCHLLKLPTELQLAIYELVVTEDRPLLLNCPCNSSYRQQHAVLREEQKQWREGDRHPPLQPALSQTCRWIRAETLRIFYGENLFRGSYCQPSKMLLAPLKWLRIIGQQNRETLKHLYFYDRNERQDLRSPRKLEQMKSALTEMGARIETLSGEQCCAHLVTFGENRKRDGEVPLALQRGGLAMRMDGEL